MIDDITNLHDQFMELANTQIFIDDRLISDTKGIIHKSIDICKDIENSQDNTAIAAFITIYKNLCRSLLFYIEPTKLAYIDNPLDDIPSKPKNTALTKAKFLSKNVFPKMLKLFSNIPKSKSLVEDLKKLQGLMEDLRVHADKSYRKNIDAWFTIYSFTLLADNITSAVNRSLR